MENNQPDRTEQALTTELRRLSDHLPSGEIDPPADLARALRSVRRSRFRLACGIALGAVAVIMAAQFVGPMIGGAVLPAPDTRVLAQPTPPASPKPTPTRKPAAKPPAWEYTCADMAKRTPGKGYSTTKPQPEPTDSAEIQLRKGYEATVRQLDPHGRHLQKGTSSGHRGLECKDGREVRSSLDSKFGWQDGTGGGQIVVTVGSDLEALVGTAINCGDTWHCESLDVSRYDDVKAGRVATFEHGFAVIIERTDGESVVVLADEAFTNNYLEPIDGFPFDSDDLIKIAIDPRLTLQL